MEDELFLLFMEYVSGQVVNFQDSDIYNELINTLQGPTRQAVIDAAESGGTEITGLTPEQVRDLAEKVAKGLEDQVGIDGIEKMIREQLPLSPQQYEQYQALKEELESKGLSEEEINAALAEFTEEKLDERAETIARTETAKALEQAEYQTQKERGARFKVWITSQDDLVSEICQACEASGAIPIDDVFAEGVDMPPAHPNCRCSVSYFDEVTEGLEDRIQEAIDATKQRNQSDDEE